MAWQLVPDQISFNAAISAQETKVSNVPFLLDLSYFCGLNG